MADVEIAVQAEGVEDAVGEVPPGEVPAGGEEGGLTGGGGGRGLGKILGVLAAVLTFAEDILKVVGVVSSVLRAFLAPVAVLLLRLLQPFLRAMIAVLPVWFDIMEMVTNVAERLNPLFGILGLLGVLIGSLAGASVGDVVSRLVSGIAGGFTLSDIETAIKNIPSRLSNLLSNLPGVGGFFGGSGDGGGGDDAGIVERAQQTVVNIGGGLSTFVDRVEQDSGIETP